MWAWLARSSWAFQTEASIFSDGPKQGYKKPQAAGALCPRRATHSQ